MLDRSMVYQLDCCLLVARACSGTLRDAPQGIWFTGTCYPAPREIAVNGPHSSLSHDLTAVAPLFPHYCGRRPLTPLNRLLSLVLGLSALSLGMATPCRLSLLNLPAARQYLRKSSGVLPTLIRGSCSASLSPRWQIQNSANAMLMQAKNTLFAKIFCNSLAPVLYRRKRRNCDFFWPHPLYGRKNYPGERLK